MKNAIGNLTGIALHLYTALGSMFILTILILPIQEHGVSFHFCCVLSFIRILQFSEYRSFPSLGRFIPGSFILFNAMVSGTLALISLSDILLLEYRNATCLYINFVSRNFTEFMDEL